MQSTGYISPQALTRQGIDALQMGDTRRAHDLLGQAIQLAPDDERAWLWLSGAVASDAERQYCLERVLEINPQNAAARRGLQKLPATPVSRSPLPAAPATSAPAVQTWPPGEESLLSILIQPDVDVAPSSAFSNRRPFDTSPAPASATAPSEPVAAAAPTVDSRDQAAIDFVIGEFGRHRSRDEIIRAMNEQHGYTWKEAEQFVSTVETGHRRAIAARQSPFLIFLGVITIIGGCFLAARAGFALYGFYFRLSPTSILSARIVVLMCGQLITGIAMVLGATIGLGQTIKSLWS